MPRTPESTDDGLGAAEVALPHFEHELWHELRAEHTRLAGAADRPEPPTHTRRRRLRSPLIAAAAAAVAIAIVATVTFVGQTTTGEPDPAVPGASAGEGAPTLETRVIAAIDEALTSSIVHVIQDNATYGDDEAWQDETTGAGRWQQKNEDGQPSYDSGVAVAPGPDDPPPDVPAPDDSSSIPALPDDWPQQLHRTVDYCFGEYVEQEMPALPPGTEAGRIRDRLADGSMRTDGTEVIDGRELLRVVAVLPPPREPGEDVWIDEQVVDPEGDAPPTTVTGSEEPDPADGSGEGVVDDSIVTYVDPDTYRPVMVRGYVGSDAEYTQTISYLPRTPENLAQLVPPIPEGFEPVPELRTDGERFDAGCV